MKQIVNKWWFTPGSDTHCIGVVEVINDVGEHKLYIGVGEGKDVDEDTQRIANWGAKLHRFQLENMLLSITDEDDQTKLG